MGRRNARRWAAWVAGFLVVASAGAGSTAGAADSAARVTLPTGFTDTVVATMNKPIALAATPDGRILVVDQTGFVRVIDHDTLLPTPALDISAKVCATNAERGVLGIAVDPNFAANGFVYLFYSFMKFPICTRDQADVPVNRVSRFKMVGNTIRASSEKVLIDEMPSYHGNDNGGGLGFGNDGMLYVSVGDGGCDYTGLSGCAADDAVSQLRYNLIGKVLRITPNGGIPRDNPFTGRNTARCNHGAIAPGMTCREIYLLGFRNPFRFAFDPNTAPTTTRLFVDDVGVHSWEEIDDAVAGADYGWNLREGPCATGSVTDCGPPPPGLANPTFAYSHPATHCGAITGGAFVPDSMWGGAYDSDYLYGDYHCHKIFALAPDGEGGWTATPFETDLPRYGPISLLIAPHDASTSLYYTTYANGGEVHVIDQTPDLGTRK